MWHDDPVERAAVLMERFGSLWLKTAEAARRRDGVTLRTMAKLLRDAREAMLDEGLALLAGAENKSRSSRTRGSA